jgi:hypothetical protein
MQSADSLVAHIRRGKYIKAQEDFTGLHSNYINHDDYNG